MSFTPPKPPTDAAAPVFSPRPQQTAQPEVPAPQQPTTQYVVQEAPLSAGAAITSMVFGVLSFVAPLFLFSVLAIVFGFVAKKGIKEGTARGEGYAKVGVVLGSITIILSIIAVVFALWFLTTPEGGNVERVTIDDLMETPAPVPEGEGGKTDGFDSEPIKELGE